MLNGNCFGRWIRSVLLSLLVSFLVLAFNVSHVFASPKTGSESCIGSICFSPALKLSEKFIPLRGAALFQFFFLDVYTAALYAPKEWRVSPSFSADQPASLIIHYHRGFSAEEISSSADELLTRQNGDLPSDVREAVKKLHTAYRDVSPGDKYELRYVPEVGTALLYNDQQLITIPGWRFAEFYYRIWLDDRVPFDSELREKLLAG